MPRGIDLSTTDREKVAVLVNNLNIFAAELISRTTPVIGTRAFLNLKKVRDERGDLIRRLDELARAQGDESPLRLIEDLPRVPTDVAQMLTMVRRCLLSAAFLAHCIAQPQAGSEVSGDKEQL